MKPSLDAMPVNEIDATPLLARSVDLASVPTPERVVNPVVPLAAFSTDAWWTVRRLVAI
jgi:hypothetical protein